MTALASQQLLPQCANAPSIHPRVDLRTGLVAAGALDRQASLAALPRALRDARLAWRTAGFTAPLSLPLDAALIRDLDPEWLDDCAREAGCAPKSLSFELDEREMQRSGPALAEALRARGWGVALDGDPACPLPFGSRARGLYTEIILDAPCPIDPYLALDACMASPLGRRIFAAREAGLWITARSVESDAEAGLLALIGFDRAGGPVSAQY